ncbi:mitochondrial fission regulator 2 [Spea bombifrons]|uniref:mitochondrial fission regulator 2 n=1 Tax=Spea bombifrons TaxID=233779 RepID=UPI00234B4897|nr:mitochondrial fission regulator 2 [Spea bombifrons]
MSLLLELVRQLFEYLGIPDDRLDQIWQSYANRRRILQALQLYLPPWLLQRINLQVVQGWERKEYGWTRSIIRVIGTLLPLDPCPRPRFQHVLGPERKATVCKSGIPSLVDVQWLSEDDVMSYTMFRHDLVNQPKEAMFLARHSDINPSGQPMIPSNIKPDCGQLVQSENAIQKIAALEDELMKLRAQIAAIVATQDTKSIESCSETLSSFGSPGNGLPPPSLASTPIHGQLTQFAAAPPPPPPPPSAKHSPGESAIDLIKQRKQAHQHSTREMDKVENINKPPSMMDVLKDINTVRLRAVERSPGGTPLTRKDKKRRSLNDPAAIIAHALKKKFAYRQNDDSFDKENRSHEDSAFSSPETPQFGRHLLRPTGKRIQREFQKKV